LSENSSKWLRSKKVVYLFNVEFMSQLIIKGLIETELVLILYQDLTMEL
jgi:hypothetical protein